MIRWFWRVTDDVPTDVLGTAIAYGGLWLVVLVVSVVMAALGGPALVFFAAGTGGLLGSLLMTRLQDRRTKKGAPPTGKRCGGSARQ